MREAFSDSSCKMLLCNAWTWNRSSFVCSLAAGGEETKGEDTAGVVGLGGPGTID